MTDIMPSTTPLTSQALWHVQLSRALAVGSLIGLIVLSLAWELWLAPLRPGGSWLAIKALPLCIPLAGLLKNRMYTYRWVSLVVWLYFAEGVIRLQGDAWPSNGFAGVEIFLCLMLFTASALHVRWRLRDAALAEQQPLETMLKAAEPQAVYGFTPLSPAGQHIVTPDMVRALRDEQGE
jgi:hypothetical protein